MSDNNDKNKGNGKSGGRSSGKRSKGDHDLYAQVSCSFCGKSESQVVRLIAGPGVFICNECVALCDEILNEDFDRLRPRINAGYGRSDESGAHQEASTSMSSARNAPKSVSRCGL